MAIMEEAVRALDEQTKSLRIALEACRSFQDTRPTLIETGNNLQSLIEELEVLRQALLRSQRTYSTHLIKIDHILSLLQDVAIRSEQVECSLRKRTILLENSLGSSDAQQQVQTIEKLVSKSLEGVESCVKAARIIIRALVEAQHCHLVIRPTELCCEIGQDAAISDPSRTSQGFQRKASRKQTKVSDLRVATNRLLFQLDYNQGCSTSEVRQSSRSAFHAVQIGSLAALKEALDGSTTVCEALDADRYSLLGRAVRRGSLDIVRYLLDAGFDIDGKFGRYEGTALHEALRCRHYEIVRFLTERGGSFSMRNNLGWTPIFSLWSSEKNAESTQFLELLSHHSQFAELYEDVFDSDGWSVLHRVCCYGAEEDVKFLLNIGLDPMVKVRDTGHHLGHEGWSTLSLAAWYGAFDAVKRLCPVFKRQLLIDTQDPNGCTALQCAVNRQHFNIALCLLLAGADPFLSAAGRWLGDEEKLPGTWLDNDDMSPDQGQTALSLLSRTSDRFRTQFWNWLLLVQLPHLIIPKSMRPSQPQKLLLASPTNDTPQTQVLTNVMDETTTIGHVYGDVTAEGGILHQGDQNSIALTIINHFHAPAVLQPESPTNFRSLFDLSISRRLWGQDISFDLSIRSAA